MKAKVLTLDSGDAGEIDLKDEIFGLEPRADLIQRVIVWQLAKRRAGTHKTKTRGEVNRTTKKVYRQKGTGSARHGARSAPQFVGGGKAMAPVLRSHEFDLPKKVRAAGLRHALSSKLRDAKLIVLDAASAGEVKTKALALRLGKLGAGHMLIVDGKFDQKFTLSARNLAKVSLLPAVGLNVYDVLRRDTLVLTRAAIQAIEERFVMSNYDIILSPVITEKSTRLSEANQVVFRVTKGATKPQIAKAVEALFKVKVKAVNTVRTKGKMKAFRGRRFQKSEVKKAIVTLVEGYQIDVTTGL